MDKGRWRCAIKNRIHSHIIDACVSKSSGLRCEIVGRVSRRLIVHLSSCTHGFCVAPAPVQNCNEARAILGHCDHSMRANLLGVSVAYEGIRTGLFGSRTDCLPDQHTPAPYSDMSRYTQENDQASSWYNRGWAPPAKQHTKNSYSGWSKRATRGYQSDYEDRFRQWEDNKPSGPVKGTEGVSKVVTVTEFEVVENRDKKHGRAATDNAASTAPAHTTWDPAAATATEKEAIRSRLGELHRLLNNSKKVASVPPTRIMLKRTTGRTT